MARMHVSKSLEEKAITGLGKVDPRTREKATIECANNGHENDQGNQPASAGTERALSYCGADVLTGSDLRDR